MKKIIPLAASIALILIAGIFASAGTLAWFSDTETVGVHDIQAGTLNLQVGSDDPCKVHLTFTDIKPGFKPTGSKKPNYIIKNTGSLDGKLSVEITNVVNKENLRNEPERVAGDTTPDIGELGAHLRFKAECLGWDSGGWVYLDNAAGTLYEVGTLKALEEGHFVLYLEVPKGTGNIIQSDSVEFDIVFYLDQA